jgi:DNA-directed RNA polymerase subunit RPC12/RpoP|nr:MAG TPA: DNA-directed RNA polymerase [Caudoviricetes sp.]
MTLICQYQSYDISALVGIRLLVIVFLDCPTLKKSVVVKLSKWVKKEVRKVGEAEAYCLTCGREVVYQVINNRYQFENYCPHCGAKMDKE